MLRAHHIQLLSYREEKGGIAMRIAMLHQYSLFASGSCVYVRNLVQQLLHLGHEVHLISREPNPEYYDFIDQAYLHHYQTGTRLLFRRSDNPACISHTLIGEITPVTRERTEFPQGKLYVDLTQEEIANHVAFHSRQIGEIVQQHGIEVMHANHVLMLPYIASLVKEELGTPYVVTVHGSAIEFVLDHDERYWPYAVHGLENADCVVALNRDVRQRTLRICPDLADRLVEISVGVNVQAFQPIPAEGRGEEIKALRSRLIAWDRPGKPRQQEIQTRLVSQSNTTAREIARQIEKIRASYEHGGPDATLPDRLAAINWENDRLLIFVGRLLLEKGVHCLIAALPRIIAEHAGVKLLIAGDGVDREALELLVYALDTGDERLVHKTLQAGVMARTVMEGEMAGATQYLKNYFAQIDMGEYLAQARGKIAERVIFTGHLPPFALTKLLPCAEICIVPSIVKEAFPLVTIEALSSGVVPVAAYFSGLVPILQETASRIPSIGEFIKLNHDSDKMVEDIAHKVTRLLHELAEPGVARQVSQDCRRIAAPKYGWENVTSRLEQLYNLALRDNGKRSYRQFCLMEQPAIAA
jgi:glycosyltransferase involved in cell wall biosynthesis